jgi:hypothetical protein
MLVEDEFIGKISFLIKNITSERIDSEIMIPGTDKSSLSLSILSSGINKEHLNLTKEKIIKNEEKIKKSKEKTLQRVSHLLDSQENLHRIQDLKQTVLNQNEMIMNKLRSLTENQIEEADASIKVLNRYENKKEEIQNYFTKINDTCKNNQALYENYPLIKKTIRTLTNVIIII